MGARSTWAAGVLFLPMRQLCLGLGAMGLHMLAVKPLEPL
jgi:hypothetical protein